MSLETMDTTAQNAALNSTEAIESFLERLEAEARRPISPIDFFHTVVEGLLAAVHADTALVWGEVDETFRCLARKQTSSDIESAAPDAMQRLAMSALQSEEVLLLPPGGTTPHDGASNPSNRLQLLVPAIDAMVPPFVLQLQLDPKSSLAARETAVNLLKAVSEIGVGFSLRYWMKQLEEKNKLWSALDAALQRIQSADTDHDRAQRITDQVRNLTRADRVSLLDIRGKRARLRSVSAVTSINRRSRQAKLLEQFATETLRTGTTCTILVGQKNDISSSAARAADALLDETDARAVRAELLVTDDADACNGILVLEHFTLDQISQWEQRMPVIAPHVSHILHHEQKLRSAGWKVLLRPFRSLSSAAVIFLSIGMLGALIAAAIFVPAELTIEAPGRLVPVVRQGIYAPADAIVSGVHVRDGDRVARDALLLTLSDPDLEQELSRVQGELDTARAELTAIEAKRRLRLRDKEIDISGLSIDAERLKITVESLARQLEILQAQQQRLQVTCPIDGVVTRWDLHDVLYQRPVRHGEHLADVYQPDGHWQIEVSIPDDVVGYVRLKLQEAPAKVEYLFQTEASVQRAATLETLFDVTELDADGKMSVRGIVPIEKETLSQPQPGATAIVKIHCGQRALGFVWGREIIEFVQKHILF